VDHRRGGLPGTAELDQPQAGVIAAQRAVELVGVALPGRDARARRIGLGAFMHAAGITCSQRLGDLAAQLPAVSEDVVVALLGGDRP